MSLRVLVRRVVRGGAVSLVVMWLIRVRVLLRFRPYAGTEYEARGVPEHLSQGHRYILLPTTADHDWMTEGVQAWRCGVLDDTPAKELAIQQGMAMNDHLRAPGLTGNWPW
jgi:hypothetical protein